MTRGDVITSVTDRLSALATLGAFIVACFYYGPGLNLSFLLYSLVLLLVALIAAGWRGFASGLLAHRSVFIGAVLTLALLALHHNVFSVSVDTSFAATLMLAVVPLAVIIGLSGSARWLYAPIFYVVSAFAVLAALAFLVQGTRAAWPLVDPNNLVTLLLMAWTPWLFWTVFRTPSPSAGRLAASTLISLAFVVALIATESRFAFIALVAIVVLLWLCFALARPRPTASALIAVSVVVVSVLALDLSFGVSSARQAAEITEHTSIESSVPAEGPFTITQAESQRIMMTGSALRMIEERGGWHGTGAYTFALLYPQYRALAEQSTNGLFVHNDFLQLALEGGIWLAAPLGILVLCLLVSGSRTFFSGRFDQSSPFGFQVAAGLVCVHALVNFTLYILPLALLFGLLISFAFQRKPVDTAELESSRPLSLGLLALVTLGLLYSSALLALDSFTYGVFSGQRGLPGVARVAASPSTIVEYARFAQRMNDDRGIPALALARYADLNPSVPEAAREALYREAVRVDPWNPQAFKAFYLSGLLAEPERSAVLAQALALAPQDVDINLSFIRNRLEAGDVEGARQAAIEVLQWCELLTRQNAAALDQLGRELTSIDKTTAGLEIAGELGTCLAIRNDTPVTQRTPSRFLRWLQDGQRG